MGRPGGSGILETTQGRFFSLRLYPAPPLLLNKVCFHPKMVCFFHVPVEKFLAGLVSLPQVPKIGRNFKV